ncbi:hypothetical protein BIW11_06819, partial [Tropilaelaps mercedesae]
KFCLLNTLILLIPWPNLAPTRKLFLPILKQIHLSPAVPIIQGQPFLEPLVQLSWPCCFIAFDSTNRSN